MGFWGAIKSSASWVTQKAEAVYDTSTDAVKNTVQDAANWVEEKAGQAYEETKDGIDAAVDWTVDEGRRIWEGGTSLYEGITEGGKAVLSDFGEGMAHVGGGLVELGSGNWEAGAKEIGGGLAQATVGGIVDGALLLGARAVSTVQVIGHIEEVGRKLTADEVAELRQVFGDSIDYDEVRIKEGDAGLFDANDRAFTTGNTIYMKMDRSNPGWRDLLAHEMTHVWQFQNGGPDYQSKSLAAQYITRDAYEWQAAAREEKPWESLNPEDQAALIEAIYASRFHQTGSFSITTADGRTLDRSAYAHKVLDQLQRGLGAP